MKGTAIISYCNKCKYPFFCKEYILRKCQVSELEISYFCIKLILHSSYWCFIIIFPVENGELLGVKFKCSEVALRETNNCSYRCLKLILHVCDMRFLRDDTVKTKFLKTLFSYFSYLKCGGTKNYIKIS